MNLFFIRTKLQCLIAQHICEKIVPEESYATVFLYQNHRKEDAPEVYKVYERLRSGAALSRDVISAKGLFNNVTTILPMMLQTKKTGGRCFLSVVDSVPIALASKIVHPIRLETFDDGAFNIQPGSRLYGSGPMVGRSFKKMLARLIFPYGSTEWMRQTSCNHYTIFPGKENILPRNKVVELNWDWECLINPIDLNSLPSKTKVVILGTPHDEYPDPEASRETARRLLQNADLYIRHPREGDWIKDSKARFFSSPAEAILIKLASLNPLTVYHFNSTTGHTLDGMRNIDLINLVDPYTRTLLS